jgi:hypothetical protein
MLKALEKAGYGRQESIQKIMEDHQDLKGFSRKTIYRQLPNLMKHTYEDSINMLPQHSDVLNDTLDQSVTKTTRIIKISYYRLLLDLVDYDYNDAGYYY